MAYTKQTWADLPSKTTPINANRLTHIEDGIFNAAATADNAASTAGTAAANVGIVSGKVETLTERVNGLDTAVSNKVDKVAGKGLSTNDYDDTDKGKVDSLGTASAKNSTSVVTESSDLVESGAVENIIGWGNKNLLPNNAISQTINGVTFTVNSDGTVKVTGSTGSDISQFQIYLPSDLEGDYYYSGCPAGGGENTYDLYGWDNFTNSRMKQWDGITNCESDFGETSQQIKVVAGHSSLLTIRIRQNQSNLNLLFKPMVSKNGLPYEPYHASVEESLAEKADNTVIGIVEDGTNPTKSYAVDEFMVRDGAFCQVTAPVTTSSTWTEGSNYTKKSIAEVLQSLMS